MLVLSREVNETVVVRDGLDAVVLEITIVKVDKKKVRIGFNGRPDISINRLEVDVAKQASQGKEVKNLPPGNKALTKGFKRCGPVRRPDSDTKVRIIPD